MGTSTVTYVTDYAGLVSLPAGSVALNHSTGFMYRVVACPVRGTVVYQLAPNGTSALLPRAGGASGGRFATGLAVVYQPSA